MKQSEITKGMICHTKVSGGRRRVIVTEVIQVERGGRKYTEYRVCHCRADGTQIANARELQPRSAAALNPLDTPSVRVVVVERDATAAPST